MPLYLQKFLDATVISINCRTLLTVGYCFSDPTFQVEPEISRKRYNRLRVKVLAVKLRDYERYFTFAIAQEDGFTFTRIFCFRGVKCFTDATRIRV